MSNWSKDKGYLNTYSCSEKFGDCVYGVNMIFEQTDKTIKFWVTASSGKKRKDLEVFEEKDGKSNGGMEALLWIKNQVLGFPKWYRENRVDKRAIYVCIGWSDSRRRKIYERLFRYGFRFMVVDGNKILIRKFD